MKNKAPHIVRIVLGLVFFVFGLNGFLHFIPQPPPPASAAHFLELMSTSYLLTFVKGTEVAVGLLLLSNRFVPLALAVLTPIVLNIVMFHATLEPLPTLALPLVLFGMLLYLAWTYRGAYAAMLHAKTPLAAPEASASTGRLQPV